MRRTRQIHLRNLPIGGGAPVTVQSMTNTDTADAEATLAQILRLRQAGCQIVRCAFPARNVAEGFRKICAESPLPVVADIHFDPTLAILALECGADGIRVNPGNLPNEESVRKVAQAAAALNRVVRIGVNLGSLNKNAEQLYGRTPEAMVHSALEYIRIFEAEGCTALKVSLKASDVKTTVLANRQFAESSDIPLHLGITEAGPLSCGIVKSSVGIGALLLDGIGDTIRVSLTAPPEMEPPAAIRILEAVGLRKAEPEIISCPTCARTRIPLEKIVQQVEEAIQKLKQEKVPITVRKIAVMGCEVNGPGEASDADVGVAGGPRGTAILFRHGLKICTVPAEDILTTLIREIT